MKTLVSTLLRSPAVAGYRAGWIVVLAVALAVSWWSLRAVALALGVPAPLAIGVSCVFDGAALVAAGAATRYAATRYSGAGPRLVLAALLGCSVYLNVVHAQMTGGGLPAAVLYAAPAVVALVLFEVERGWQNREARRAAGRLAPALPVVGRYGWIFYPGRSLGVLRAATAAHLDALAPGCPILEAGSSAGLASSSPAAPAPAVDPVVVEQLAALPSDSARVRHAADTTGLTGAADVAEWLRKHGHPIERETARTALRRRRPSEDEITDRLPVTSDRQPVTVASVVNGHAVGGVR